MSRLRMAVTKKLPAKYHSPAGRKHLGRKKKKKSETEPVYFKGIRRPSLESQLRGSLTESELARFRSKPLKRKKK